jgi:hypothetical protein
MITLQSTYRLLYVYGTTEAGPLVLACCFNSPAVRTDCLAETRRGDEALLPPTTYADCFVQIIPTHSVLRGIWDQARIELEATAKLSLHLGGMSVWFEPGLERGSFSTAHSQTISFTCQTLEVWSEQ